MAFSPQAVVVEGWPYTQEMQYAFLCILVCRFSFAGATRVPLNRLTWQIPAFTVLEVGSEENTKLATLETVLFP